MQCDPICSVTSPMCNLFRSDAMGTVHSQWRNPLPAHLQPGGATWVLSLASDEYCQWKGHQCPGIIFPWLPRVAANAGALWQTKRQSNISLQCFLLGVPPGPELQSSQLLQSACIGSMHSSLFTHSIGRNTPLCQNPSHLCGPVRRQYPISLSDF